MDNGDDKLFEKGRNALLKKLIPLIALPNRMKSHFFMGDYRSDTGDKTTVERGNVFSPGVWTVGISVIAWDVVDALSVEQLPDEAIRWSLFEKELDEPVSRSSFALKECSFETELRSLGNNGSGGADFFRVFPDRPITGQWAILVRTIGPAGCLSTPISLDKESISFGLNGVIKALDTPCDVLLFSPEESHCPGAAAVLTPRNVSDHYDFIAIHPHADHALSESNRLLHQFHADDAIAENRRRWAQFHLPSISCPDPRIEKLWYCLAYHLLTAMESVSPRIGAVNYPFFWMRDGVIVLEALELLGLHEIAGHGVNEVVGMDYCGGFGAESDIPGEALWIMQFHHSFVNDEQEMKELFPFVRRKVAMIERMLQADEIQFQPSPGKTASQILRCDNNLFCYPAVNGWIHGRMDHHSPDFFINVWAWRGLVSAADLAKIAGMDADAHAWSDTADKLLSAIRRNWPDEKPNERDLILFPHPSGIFNRDDAEERSRFFEAFQKCYFPEPETCVHQLYWSYFEVASAHNAFLLGYRDHAWKLIDFLLDSAGDCGIFSEGPPMGNEYLPFKNFPPDATGWLARNDADGGNMPHNWTNAEMIALIRDLFVTEEYGNLLLGRGIPDAWCRPGATIKVTRMPTRLGSVSLELQYDGKQWRGHLPPQSRLD